MAYTQRDVLQTDGVCEVPNTFSPSLNYGIKTLSFFRDTCTATGRIYPKMDLILDNFVKTFTNDKPL